MIRNDNAREETLLDLFNWKFIWSQNIFFINTLQTFLLEKVKKYQTDLISVGRRDAIGPKYMYMAMCLQAD